jgi:TolB-like protein/Flp pilus assembly protein TadD
MTNQPGPYQTLFAELKRRQVFRIAAVYGAVAFGVMQLADVVFPAIGLPEWTVAFVVALSLIGFPIALVLAWAFESTPDGVRRTDPATSGELRAIVAEPRSARWPAGLLAFAGMILLIGGVWWVASHGVASPGDGAGALQPDSRSIAVLPFANMSGDPENEYFSDGITDDIITHLSKLSDLKVISRTSVMRYKDSDKGLLEIADELGVATILEGGVQRSGDRVRINAQLIDAQTDEHLWAEQYNRQLTDVFAIQSDVAFKIADALHAQLTPDERGQVARTPTENLDAYNLYLQGRYFWNKRSRDGLETALDLFLQATQIDPDYAPAWVGVADSYSIMADWGFVAPADASREAMIAAETALRIDPALGEAHIALAQTLSSNNDWDGATAAYEKGVALSPGYATGHQWYAGHLGTIGRLDEAIEQIELAVKLDPLSLIINTNVGMILRWAGEYDRAAERLRKAIELDPHFVGSFQELGTVYEEQGKYEEAREMYLRTLEESDRFLGQAELGHLYGAAGRRAEALELLSELEEAAKTRHVSPMEFAFIHAGLGNIDEAFEWLERSIETGDPTFSWRILTPGVDELRDDPRFVDLLRRVGLGE